MTEAEATAVMQDGWPPVHQEEVDTPPVRAQVLLVGPDRMAQIGTGWQGPIELTFHQPRRPAVVGGLDEGTGGVVFQAAEVVLKAGRVYPSDLPQVAIASAGEMHDIADVPGAQLTTVRKGRTAQRHWPVGR